MLSEEKEVTRRGRTSGEEATKAIGGSDDAVLGDAAARSIPAPADGMLKPVLPKNASFAEKLSALLCPYAIVTWLATSGCSGMKDGVLYCRPPLERRIKATPYFNPRDTSMIVHVDTIQYCS